MKLILNDPDSILSDSFISWLKIKLKDHIIDSISDEKLKAWDKYLNEVLIYKSIYKKRISSKDIINAGCLNLIATRTSNNIEITINPNIYVFGLHRIKLSSICRLINFGNNDINGYHIFTTSFNYFKSNLKIYIDRFALGIL